MAPLRIRLRHPLDSKVGQEGGTSPCMYLLLYRVGSGEAAISGASTHRCSAHDEALGLPQTSVLFQDVFGNAFYTCLRLCGDGTFAVDVVHLTALSGKFCFFDYTEACVVHFKRYRFNVPCEAVRPGARRTLASK